MAQSRLPLRVSAGGAFRSRRACSSLSAGVRPSLVLPFGRFTPFAGLCTTALRSQRYANSEETAESLYCLLAPISLPYVAYRKPCIASCSAMRLAHILLYALGE
jgi:hypothetical protein